MSSYSMREMRLNGEGPTLVWPVLHSDVFVNTATVCGVPAARAPASIPAVDDDPPVVAAAELLPLDCAAGDGGATSVEPTQPVPDPASAATGNARSSAIVETRERTRRRFTTTAPVRRRQE
jgi:hypothetical protein